MYFSRISGIPVVLSLFKFAAYLLCDRMVQGVMG